LHRIGAFCLWEKAVNVPKLIEWFLIATPGWCRYY
jgi:hypothetical protein